jgi:hypothetical protein
VADDPLAAYLADARKRLEDRDALVARLGRGASVSSVELNVPQDRLAALFPSLLAAVEAALAAHPVDMLVQYWLSCSRHYASVFGRSECPDCRFIEYVGCDGCRNEAGHPSRPEECSTRTGVTIALLGEEATSG